MCPMGYAFDKLQNIKHIDFVMHGEIFFEDPLCLSLWGLGCLPKEAYTPLFGEFQASTMDFGDDEVLVPRQLLSELLEDGICPLHLRIQIQRLLATPPYTLYPANPCGSRGCDGPPLPYNGMYAEASQTLQTPEVGVTSVSMRGVSRGLTMGGLIEMLDRASRHLERPRYDFVYLPSGTKKVNNIGLAFVNFEDSASCLDFFATIQRDRTVLQDFDIRHIGPATIQGRGPNLEDTIQKRGYRILWAPDAPLVFERGMPVSLATVVAQELPAVWSAIKAQQGQKGARPRVKGTQKGQLKGRSPQGRGKGKTMGTSGTGLGQAGTEED
eukprot:s3813_g2.t1